MSFLRQQVPLDDIPCSWRLARALRGALKAKAIEITHGEPLELIARAFGYKNWNILSAKIEAAEAKPSDERWLPPSGTRDRERADPSQITPDYIVHPARLAVKDIGYKQRGFNWQKASTKVYLHGQSGRYCAARGLHRQEGCRRPKHHVRLCVPGDARADASADLLCAPHSQDLAR